MNMRPNRAVNTDAHRQGFAHAVIAGYLTRWGAIQVGALTL